MSQHDPLTALGYAPVKCFHPRAFIIEEMQERGWEPAELAQKLAEGGEGPLNALGWLLYFGTDGDLRLGESGAADLSRVFGASPEFWLELERQYFAEVEARS